MASGRRQQGEAESFATPVPVCQCLRDDASDGSREKTCQKSSISSWWAADRREQSLRPASLKTPAAMWRSIEAGERPPDVEHMPVACAAMQFNPATDWMYTADPGKAGLGLRGRRVPVPRGKMLGGSSGFNYMAYVRGHPARFRCMGGRRRHRMELRRCAALLPQE